MKKAIINKNGKIRQKNWFENVPNFWEYHVSSGQYLISPHALGLEVIFCIGVDLNSKPIFLGLMTDLKFAKLFCESLAKKNLPDPESPQ